MPPAMLVQFDALDRTGKTVFIASGLNSMYLAEWDYMYIQVLSVVKCAYNHILNTFIYICNLIYLLYKPTI